jgi:mono/diheme cytochrome c family protein
MSIELKGLVNGVIAAVVSLALVFGLAAILKPKETNSFSPKQNPSVSRNGVQVTTTLVLQGHQDYTQYCVKCHGDQGEGVMGPDIRNEDMTDDQITDIVSNGKRPMPAFKDKLTADQIKGIVLFVRTLKK